MTISEPTSSNLLMSIRCATRLRACAALCGLLVLLPLAGCQSQRVADFQPARTQVPTYTLGPGDKLRVDVFEHDDISGTFTVDDQGSISLPLIRRVNVEGMTLRQVEEAVSEELRANLIVDPRVSVDLTELRPLCVLGEVRSPGCFPYLYGMTASQAIALAGGYTYRARKEEFVITQEDGAKMLAEDDTPVFSGDVIQILERHF